MAGASDAYVLLRLTVASPPNGVMHSLQDKASAPVDAAVSTGKSMVFEIPVRLEEGKTSWRFLGEFVRAEGKTRRFVYVATGRQAGQHPTELSRRAKVDLPEVTPAIVKAAARGLVLEAAYPGTDDKGGPTCATVKVAWKVAAK